MTKQDIENGIINLFRGANKQVSYQQIGFEDKIVYSQPTTIVNNNVFSDYLGGFERDFNDALCVELNNINKVPIITYLAQDRRVDSHTYHHINDNQNVFKSKKEVCPDIITFNNSKNDPSEKPNYKGSKVDNAIESGHYFIGQNPENGPLDKTFHELWKLKTAGIDKCFYVAIYTYKENCMLNEVKNETYYIACNENLRRIYSYRKAINCLDPNYSHFIFPTVRKSGNNTYIHILITELIPTVPAMSINDKGVLRTKAPNSSYLAPKKKENGKWRIRLYNDVNFDKLNID